MAEVVAGAEHGQGHLRGVLPAGTSLRGYELKSILGQGAFGITYRGRDLNLDRDVAIKEYLPTSLALREGRTTVLPRSPDHAEQFAWGRERFLDEARTLAKLDRTPAIVRVHDYLEDNGTAYMVMALIEGETLAKRLQREQRLTPEGIEQLLFPLLDGLEEVHGVGFLHRDIKPANIMVDEKGRPTLIDFGASRAAMAERSTTLTAIFTPGYAAAEQFTSAQLGPWSDIYGLAATLYHAITGQIPPSAIDRILNDRYEPLSELKPAGFSPALLAGIDIALAIRSEDRPQSIADWRQMLKPEAFHASSLEATRIARKPGPLARVAGRSRRARITIGGRTLWAAAAAAILLVAGGGYLAWVASTSSSLSTATLNLTAEQLEQALAERRKADTLAAEKRRLEDEARQKVESESQAQRQAEAELEQARQARQKAEDELAKLKASIEAARQADSGQPVREAAAARRVAEEAAQRKAETEAAVLRQAEDEAQKKAAADAEAKRKADEALARAETERQEAEQAARLKADAEATALSKASEEELRKAAEAEKKSKAEEAEAKAQAKAKADTEKAEAVAAESGLRLDDADRKRLQVALTSLGFDTRGNDGVFGPRSREAVAGWQQKAGVPATGYFNAAQRDQILRAAASAVTRWDEEQKKADEEAKAKIAALLAPPTASPTPPVLGAAASSAPSTSAYDGVYAGAVPGTQTTRLSFAARVSGGIGLGTISGPGCSASPFSMMISATGNITGQGELKCPLTQGSGIQLGPFTISGHADGKNLELALMTTRGTLPVVLRPSSADALGAVATGAPPTTASDGPYSGEATAAGYATIRSRVYVSLQMNSGRGSGTIEMPGTANCGTSRFSLSVSPTGSVSGDGTLTCPFGSAVEKILPGPISVSGTYRDGRFELTFGNSRFSFNASLNRGSGSPASSAGPFDGTYGGSGMLGTNNMYYPMSATIRIVGTTGSGELKFSSCTSPASLQVTPSGDVTGSAQLCEPGQRGAPLSIRGRVGNGQLEALFSSLPRSGTLQLKLGAAASEAPVPPSTSAFDGTYTGAAPRIGGNSLAPIRLNVANGRGSGTIDIPGCGTGSISMTISPTGDINGQGEGVSPGGQCTKAGRWTFKGRVDGRTLEFSVSGETLGTGSTRVMLMRSAGDASTAPLRWTTTAALAPSSALNSQCLGALDRFRQGFTFELGESVLVARGGGNYEAPIAPDGTVKFRLAGGTMELSGNARTRDLRVTIPSSGCVYDLTPQ